MSFVLCPMISSEFKICCIFCNNFVKGIVRSDEDNFLLTMRTNAFEPFSYDLSSLVF